MGPSLARGTREGGVMLFGLGGLGLRLAEVAGAFATIFIEQCARLAGTLVAGLPAWSAIEPTAVVATSLAYAAMATVIFLCVRRDLMRT